MKKTKQLLAIALICFILAPVLNSCKKGDDDPFLSLRSRDARITGEWQLKEFQSTRMSPTFDGNTITTMNSFSGSLWNWSRGPESDSWSYSREITIEKDGTYTYKETEDGVQTEHNGRWSWRNDAKNKTSISLTDHGLFYIEGLSNDELIVTEDSESTEIEDGKIKRTTYTSRTVYEKK